MDKQTLRRTILAQRRALTQAQAEQASAAVCGRLAALPCWAQAREVLVYLAFGGEISVTPLLYDLWARGVRVLAPRCRPGEKGRMDIACLTCAQELTPGPFGIQEPDARMCQALEFFAPDVALVPAVAFDRTGARLGFGHGYYDRLLAGPGFDNTLLAGLGHHFQVVDSLPRDPWDKPVHVILTDQEAIWP